MGYVSSLSSTVEAYEPLTTSGDISFSGLGNGTDFSEIIDAIVDSESYQLEEYEDQKEEYEYLIDLMDQLSDEIDEFNDILDDMDEPDEFYSMVAEVSDDQVEVDADGDAEPGIHTISVNQLALNDVWVNMDTAYESEDTVIADEATTLTVNYGGEDITIDVAAGTTLEGLITTINGSVDARDKFEASIMNDGDACYLMLKSCDAGADNNITITDTGSLSGMSAGGFVNTQTGQNSQIKVDGFPPGEGDWIERDSNAIDDVVDGLTFNLKDTTDGDTLQVSVEYDTDDMYDTILEFQESLNAIIEDIQILTGRVTEEQDTDDDSETYTLDSYALDIVYNNIKSILSSSALGFTRYDEETGGDYYNALSQIGFYTDTDEDSDTYGQLLLDEDELEDALDTDAAAVASLFSARAEGESDSEDFQVISVIDGVTGAGEHEVKYTISGGEITSATIDGEEAAIDGQTILATSGDAKGLYLSIASGADGDYEGTARVKQGKIGELSDALDTVTNAETGSLTILIDHYEESVTSLDNQIYNEEKRLDALETSLERKYAALDALLATYTAQGDTLTSLLEAL
ncbi:flagellar hook-associated 2 domain-containing protein [Pseudodesulfovibrio mercurii]|uniref:Flagellar hook-associated protein 2 n=1 Tax=Pseudodesulfovibrio mercurii TaxID=641491 RepID=F0JK14_9BACT|nr:flagellar filament capping protein FliD [Pseudodesulfovibrio mercurii]EGB16263.1 flagellar hook-associated 2 domain-containing protein [Pseudodesulfovibrio mercurii]